MQVKGSVKIWVGSLINCYNPSCVVKVSILVLSHDTERTWIDTLIYSILNILLPILVLSHLCNISVGWLGKWYKEIKLHRFYAINTWKMIHSWRYFISNIFRANDCLWYIQTSHLAKHILQYYTLQSSTNTQSELRENFRYTSYIKFMNTNVGI